MKLFHLTSWICGVASGAAGLLLLKKMFFESEKESIECLFFSPRDIHYSRTDTTCGKVACPLCNFSVLCALLKTTQKELDVCMYLITEQEISKIVVALHRRGVKVRMITDKQMTEDALRCKSGLFVKYNIPMKCIEAAGMMHNKFFIIDQKIVVSGSPNWTQHGFMSNYENVLIIKSSRVAKMYEKYFSDIWAEEKFSRQTQPYSKVVF